MSSHLQSQMHTAHDSEAQQTAAAPLEQQSNLSRSQWLIYLGQQLDPQDPLYNMTLRFDLQGDVDVDCFQSAFEALVERCDALRTVFVEKDGVPQQQVLPEMRFRPTFIDFSDRADATGAVAQWISQRCRRSLDLGKRCFDSVLLKTAPAQFVWFFNQHHLITDAWSTAVIYSRLASFYARLRSGEQPEQESLPSFAEYLAYERGLRTTEPYRNAVAYWQSRAQQTTQRLRLYGQAPAERSSRTERLACPLGERRTRLLRELAQQPGIRMLSQDMTLFKLFATVLFAYLWRVANSSSVVIGTPAHNRSSLAFRETAGLFIELFPLRANVDEAETFHSLMDKVGAESQAFLRHAMPGASSVAGLKLFNVVLNYIHATFEPFDGLPMQPQWIHTGHGDPEHDLRLQLHDFGSSGSFMAYFDFNCAVFSRDMQQHAVRHFLLLLDAFLEDPGQPIGKVNLTSPAEREQLVDEFNRTAEPPAPCQSVVALFRQQARLNPQRIALSQGQHNISFEELEQRSDRLARLLMQRGAGADALIGIFIERSIELVVAMLAVLKTGAAYVPLESRLPNKRLGFILEDTGARIVLTREELRQRLPAALEAIALDSDWESLCTREEALPDVQAHAPAYVIYTSGSTGQPKGVVIDHQGLASYATWAHKTFSPQPQPVFALFSSIGFDLTVTSIFVPLISGGSIIVYPEEEGAVDLAVLRVFAEGRADTVKLTPAHLRLVAGLDLKDAHIKSLILGGEDLKTADARRIVAASGGKISVYNEYGPTEAVVGCMVHRFDRHGDRDSSVPIGVPADGVRIYVLDAGLNPVPQGVAGELYIGGSRLARCYFNREELTFERFLEDPFVGGGRMYRSGDLARFNNAGILQYLGRNDEQLKVRGVRIEPAEIEHALLEHPAIDACVLKVSRVARRDNTQDLRYCSKCGLASNYPDISIDATGVCNICREFEHYHDRAESYFGSLRELEEIFDAAQKVKTGEYDCLMLLSGGKDSTYAIYQVAAIARRVLAVTLDNGYISDVAKANIKRVVTSLGIEHRYLSTPAMNAIFVDSLERHSNVCHGCFKTLYTLAVETALAEGIPLIVTGLSRGQFFETRLTPEQFRQNAFDVEAIDRTVLEARKAYHRIDDAVSRLLNVDMFKSDAIFDQVRFVDFYRYSDVSLEEMYAFLAEHAPWVRPGDTGRSTNCLINDAGIYVHKNKEGYHNYALPYSWDVRLGHKQRDTALDELNDHIDIARVHRILQEIGYHEDGYLGETSDVRVTAFFTATEKLSNSDLRAFLAERLQEAMVPSAFVQLEAMPLTVNGKIDRDALPEPRPGRPVVEEVYREPDGGIEELLAGLWREVLRIKRVGADDNFFDLGGDSIAAIQIVAKANTAGIHLTTQQLFQHQTIAELAHIAEAGVQQRATPQMLPGPVSLTPIQHWFFEQRNPQPELWNHVVVLGLRHDVSPDHLAKALRALLEHHQALRFRFRHVDGEWLQELPAGLPAFTPLRIDLRRLDASLQEQRMAQVERRLHEQISLSDGRLFAAALIARGPLHGNALMLVAHHLVVDAVSWLIIAEDLDLACRQLEKGEILRLPDTPSSFRDWGDALQQHGAREEAEAQRSYWMKQLATPSAPPAAPVSNHASAELVSVALTPAETAQLVDDLPRRYRMQPHEILAAALALTLASHFSSSRVRIDIERHGRNGLSSAADVSRTVGWFTAIHPLSLELDITAPLAGTLRKLKEQLRAVPGEGIGYGILQYLSAPPLEKSGPWGGVLFNYLGQAQRGIGEDAWFEFERPLALARAAAAPRCYNWEVNARIDNGFLMIDWGYSTMRDSSAAIGKVTALLLENLRAIIAAAQGSDSRADSASDFPLAGLNQDGLDKLSALLKKS